MFYFIFVLKDFELIDLNRFKKINELKLSNELLNLLNMINDDDKKDYEIEYIKTKGVMNDNKEDETKVDTELYIDSEEKTLYPGIYINSKTNNTIKTAKDLSTESNKSKGFEFNVTQHEIFIEYLMKTIFPKDNMFYSQSKNVVDDERKPFPTYFKILDNNKSNNDGENKKNKIPMKTNFTFPFDYTRNDIDDILEPILNRYGKERNYYYPINPTDDDKDTTDDDKDPTDDDKDPLKKKNTKYIYDVNDIILYRQKLYNDYKKSNELNRRGVEYGKQFDKNLSKNVEREYYDRIRYNKYVSEDDIRDEFIAKKPSVIEEFKNTVLDEKLKQNDTFFKNAIDKAKTFIRDVSRQKKVNMNRNNTIVYFVSFDIKLDTNVDDPSKFLNVKRNEELKIIKSEKTIKDEIERHIEDIIDCKKAKKEYKYISDTFLSFITGIDEYKDRTQTYYDIPVLDGTKIIKDNKLAIDSESKKYSDDLKSKYDYSDEEILRLAKSEIESIISYLHKNRKLRDMYDSNNNKTFKYENIDKLVTYKKIKNNDDYKDEFKSINSKRSKIELDKTRRNVLDYITEIYRSDKDLVKSIVKQIGDSKLYYHKPLDVINYIISDDDEKKKIQDANEKKNKDNNNDKKTIRELIKEYMNSGE